MLFQETISLYIERSDFFLKLLWQHTWISLTAIFLATVIGLALGIFISEFKKSASPVLATVNFIYTIPAISLLGFLIPVSGIGNTTAIIALTVYALLPMLRNTYTGLNNIDPAILEAAIGMGSTPLQLLYKIKLPLAVPFILSSLRNMMVMTIALAGIASFIGAGGLGVAIYRGITTNHSAMTLAGSLLIAALALANDLLLGFFEKQYNRSHLSRYKKKSKYLKWFFFGAIIILIFLAIWNFSKQKKTIHIATKPMTEQYILGSMLSLLIQQDTNLKVEITNGVGGGTSNIHPALLKGDFDLYPEYTGTAWNFVLKEKKRYNETLFAQLQDAYLQRYNLSWQGLYGFNNTFGLAVRKEIASRYRLKTYSDLARVAPLLRFGAEYDFYEREDGFNNLSKTYGFVFKSKTDLDIGLKYQALFNNQIDVINIFTTDGQLSSNQITVLKDDKNFYPSYRCGTVVRKKTLKKYPLLEGVLFNMQDILSEKEMAKLNYLVETENQSPQEVARDFLHKKGMLK